MRWDADPLWASVYDWTVEHPIAGGMAWRVGVHSDLGLLYRAAGETGLLEAGSRVLDVPCGGGVALRGVWPGQGLDYVATDISPAMLERTRALAERHGVADQVTTTIADVGDLPFDDGSFDRVVTLTGLHCFPDPARAVAELTRVLRPGGVLLGSALLNDTGLRFEPMRRAGRLAGLMGPGCTGPELVTWLGDGGVDDVRLTRSGALGYVRGTKRDA
ncbi:class I SAM-dependent methyltransferase [Nocardioides marinquilinus]